MQPMPPSEEEQNTATPEAVDPARLELLERWKLRVRRAQEIRKSWERDYRVEECAKYVLGRQNTPGRRDVVFNHVLAAIKTSIPNLVFTNPGYTVKPKQAHNTPVT